MKKFSENILDQLKGDQGGYKIPEGYLENFSVNPDFDTRLAHKSETGFFVPEGYFENFEPNILETNKKSNPENGFTIPENYFEDFEVVTHQTNNEAKVHYLPSKLLLKIGSIAIAASILLFFGLNLTENNKGENLSQLSTQDIESWVYENASQFTTDDITEVFQENELTLNSFDFESEVNSYLSEKDIESMLIQEEP